MSVLNVLDSHKETFANRSMITLFDKLDIINGNWNHYICKKNNSKTLTSDKKAFPLVAACKVNQQAWP